MDLHQLYQDTRDVGKRIKGTKKYHLWEFVLDNEFNKIELFHSKLSGKKKLCLNAQVLIQDKSYQNHFSYSFRIRSSNIELSQVTSDLFELRINNRPFEMLIFEERSGKNQKIDYHYQIKENGYEIVGEIGHEVKKPKQKDHNFKLKKNGFSRGLNENFDYNFDHDELDDFNIDNNVCYEFSNDQEGNKAFKKQNSFEASGSKGFRNMRNNNHEEKPKSKFAKEKNDYDLDENTNKQREKDETFQHNLSVLNTIQLQNNPIPFNVSNNNNVDSFFSNNDSIFFNQRVNAMPQEHNKTNLNVNQNNFQLPVSSDNSGSNYNLMNHPLQFNTGNNLMNCRYTNQLQDNFQINQGNSLNYSQIPMLYNPKEIYHNNQLVGNYQQSNQSFSNIQNIPLMNMPCQDDIKQQQIAEYPLINYPNKQHLTQLTTSLPFQGTAINEIQSFNQKKEHSFETNTSSPTNHSLQQPHNKQNKLQTQIASSGLVDMTNILGNQQNQNRAIDFQFKRSPGFD